MAAYRPLIGFVVVGLAAGCPGSAEPGASHVPDAGAAAADTAVRDGATDPPDPGHDGAVAGSDGGGVPDAAADVPVAGDAWADAQADAATDVASDTAAGDLGETDGTMGDVVVSPDVAPCVPGGCDDGNPCTTDHCEPAVGCQHFADPDVDGDGASDDCVVASGCGDLVEYNVLLRWSAVVEGGYATVLKALEASEAPAGAAALRAETAAPFAFVLRYTQPGGAVLDVTDTDELRLIVRGENHNSPTWQGNLPVVTLRDAADAWTRYTPTSQLLSEDGQTWVPVAIPLAGGPGWLVDGPGADLSALREIDVFADTWGQGFTLDIDGVAFERHDTVCALDCPGDCGGHGQCQPAGLGCLCDLGWSGAGCAECAVGFAPVGTTCALPGDAAFDHWPNPVSRTNSDPWLAVHHSEIAVVRPRLLVLNFVNVSSAAAVDALIGQVTAGIAEGSRPAGWADQASSPQVVYELAKPVIDLRDGVAGHPAAPPDWPYENSTLYPRRAPGQPGAWRFDYAALFGDAFAFHYGFPDPGGSGFLSLCELIDSGEINELWVVGSGDVPDASAAEVLEHKQRYTPGGNRIPGSFDRCAGNGCFDVDVPVCGRSVRIGWVNYNRGPGCYLHSHGHGVESAASRGIVPAWERWFRPFARFDLDQTEGLPFETLYGLHCNSNPCIAFPTAHSAVFTVGTTPIAVDPFDPVCGNVHFPPNGQDHYDYLAAPVVWSSCQGFGRHQGAAGTDALTLVSPDLWAGNAIHSWDCGGEFLVWWYQAMPGFGSGQTHADGTPMPSSWPFLFY